MSVGVQEHSQRLAETERVRTLPLLALFQETRTKKKEAVVRKIRGFTSKGTYWGVHLV